MAKESCDFCKTIYPDHDWANIVFRRGKYSSVIINRGFITIDCKGRYFLYPDPDDPYEVDYLTNIKFCSYCGRKLMEV